MTVSNKDMAGVLKASYDDETGTLLVGSFLEADVGNKIVIDYPSDTTETYSYQRGSTVLYVLTVTYTNSTKNFTSSIERTT